MKIKEKIRKAIINYALKHYSNEFLAQPKNVRCETVRVETVQAVAEMSDEVFRHDEYVMSEHQKRIVMAELIEALKNYITIQEYDETRKDGRKRIFKASLKVVSEKW
nr:MAG TPA: hypothetical protein [Caudoviricetes sp.]